MPVNTSSLLPSNPAIKKKKEKTNINLFWYNVQKSNKILGMLMLLSAIWASTITSFPHTPQVYF